MNKKDTTPLWVKSLISVLTLFSGSALISANVNVEINQTPESSRMGWVAPELPDDVAEFRVVGSLPGYTSEGTVSNLWDFSQRINDGEHFPTYRQEVGDCVANGAANAVNYLQAVQLGQTPEPFWAVDEESGDVALTGPPEFRTAHRPFIYGVSRTDPKLGNKRLRGDGSTGYWAAYACRDIGVIAATGDDVPKYNGSLARKWGKSGPPKKFINQAKEFRVREVALVTSYEAARDALASGYPVTIASNQGFVMKPVESDGKSWGKPKGNWNHQMCLIGVDDTVQGPFGGPKGAVYCLNSWGATAHGKPADDAPPGGFWIDRRTADRILSQKDSWAYSNFDGFPVRDLDFQVFGAMPPPVRLASFVESDNTMPLAASFGMNPDEVSRAGQLGLWICGCCVFAIYGTHRKHRRRNVRGSVA